MCGWDLLLDRCLPAGRLQVNSQYGVPFANNCNIRKYHFVISGITFVLYYKLSFISVYIRKIVIKERENNLLYL